MSKLPYLHELPDVRTLYAQLERERDIPLQLIEKDYWIMHCLWGLNQSGLSFELKGGTSLSKGFGIIDRFSEDIDIKIIPPEGMDVPTGLKQMKPAHIAARLDFYDWLSDNIQIPGITNERDRESDDKKGRNGMIRLRYQSLYETLPAVKPWVLLEIGFDKTTPNTALDISSWALDRAIAANVDCADNKALAIKCYLPEYTFVDKLSAVSRRYRLQQERGLMPVNFIRHYYDLYCLLGEKRVLDFIGTPEYQAHLKASFSDLENSPLPDNEAFKLSDNATRDLYAAEYARTRALYISNFPEFSEIITRIQKHLPTF